LHFAVFLIKLICMRGEIEVRIMLSEGDWTQRTITSRPFNSLRAAFIFVNRFNKGTDYTSDVYLEARVFSKAGCATLPTLPKTQVLSTLIDAETTYQARVGGTWHAGP
jgi:hypothetical protein